MTISLFTMSWKEWRRRPARTVVTVVGVALGVATLFALLAFEGGYRQAMKGELDRLGAHVLVVPKGCPYDAASLALHGANWPCFLKASYLAELRAVPGVAAAVPILMHALRDDAGQLVVYLGTDIGILGLRPHWRINGRFPEKPGEVLVGAELARRPGFRLGESFVLPGLPNEHAKVSGVLAPTHDADDYYLHLLLAESQRLFHRDHELTHVLVRLRDPQRMDEVVRQLRSCDAGMNLNVVPLAHLFGNLQRMVNSTRWLLQCVVLVALLSAGAGVSNALLMAVVERAHELGLLRALGASPGDLFRLIQLESLWICGIGGGLGIVIALAAAHRIEAWLRARLPFVPAGEVVSWDWAAVGACLIGTALLGSLAAWLPAWQAARAQPAGALATPGSGL
jgi:ABC-type lipoprotein release transport system permease subunit